MKNFLIILIIILVIVIAGLFFIRLLPIILLIMAVMLPNWLLIKKLSHDIKLKLSIVFLIIGILMLIGGGIGLNSTSKRDYRLENNIGDTIKNNGNTYLDNNSKKLSDQHDICFLIVVAGGLITVEGIIFLIGTGKKQEQIDASIEKNEEIKYNNEGYSKTLNQENMINQNKTIYDYKEKSSELNKIYNLYKNQIYNEKEYKIKKEKWIESLKLLNFNMVEIDFLNEIIAFVNDGIIENEELETIKYIVSGEYAKDKYREEKEQIIKAEEEARKKREETINNIKNKTKEMTSNTINKISSITRNNSNTTIVADDQLVCECGEKFEEEDVFCQNCGKKLK